MAKSSILGGERAPSHPSGKSTDLLGPSDSSDSGSDALGEMGADELRSDSDRFGTGERGTAGLDDAGLPGDILPDHIEHLPGSRGDDPDPEDRRFQADELADDLAADLDGDEEEPA